MYDSVCIGPINWDDLQRVRVNVSLTLGDLVSIDHMCEVLDVSRSTYFATLHRAFVANVTDADFRNASADTKE